MAIQTVRDNTYDPAGQLLEFKSPYEEAAWVVNEIQSAERSGMRLEDMLVVSRTNKRVRWRFLATGYCWVIGPVQNHSGHGNVSHDQLYLGNACCDALLQNFITSPRTAQL
jgi:superfamily I DNA and RNA helicase